MDSQQARDTKALGANQGLYNGFLAAGLIWSLFAPAAFQIQLALFFLICVLIAALYGGWTVSRRIALLQGSPALLAVIVLILTRE
jgi:putative membrane protein